MAGLLSWAKKELNTVYHGISPFDNGQGWTSTPPPARRPVAQPPAPRLVSSGPVRIGNLNINNPGPPVRTPGPDPVAKYLHTALVTPIEQTVQQIITSPAAYGVRVAAAQVTGNSRARANAVRGLNTSLRQALPPPATITKNGKTQSNPEFNQYVTGIAAGAEGAPIRVGAPKVPVTPARVTRLDRAFKSTTDVMHKIDPQLSNMVKQRREVAETGAAQAKARLKLTNSLKPEEQTNLARVLKGTEKPVNEKVLAASKEARAVLNTAYYHAKRVGVPVKAFRKDYFPQIHNPKSFQEGTSEFDSAVQHLVKSGQAKNPADAIGQLRNYRESRKLGPYGNLSKSRTLDLPGYAENNAAIHQYLDRAYATIAHTKIMGKNEAKLNKVFANIRANGGDVEQAIKSYKQASGLERGSQGAQRTSQAVTNVQGSTKLGLSALGNVQQQVNNAIVGGIGRTGKNIIKYPFSKESKNFVKQTGVTDEQVAHEALFGEQGISKFRQLTAPFFEPVEKGNRAVGAVVGRDMARNLAKKAAKGDAKAMSELTRQFGIEKLTKTGKLYKADEVRAGRAFVERTQFRTGPQDLPGWASTPTGRVVTQFKRYPYKQVGFLRREVINEARRGNPMPLARLLAVGVPVGLGVNSVTDKIRGTNFNNSPAQTALNVASDVTGANLIVSLAQQLYPSSPDANAYTAKVVKALGGPTVSDAVKSLQAGFDASKGKFTNAERFGLQHVPVVGTPAQNRLLPYKTGGGSGQAQGDSKQETASFKKTVGTGYGLNKLSNGKYIYSIKGQIHTTADITKARKALASAAFKDGGGAYRAINYANGDNLILRRSLSGSVSTTTKEQFQYSLDSATLTHLKNIGDTQGYIKTANDLIANIDRQLNDKKNTDPLDAAKLQNKKDTLLKQLKKYGVGPGLPGQSSGSSNRRGRSANRGTSTKKTPFITTGLKTASQSKPPKPPAGIKIKKPTVKSSLKVRKLSPGKKPKIG